MKGDMTKLSRSRSGARVANALKRMVGACVLMLCLHAGGWAQQAPAPADAPATNGPQTQDPVLTRRPPARPSAAPSAVTPEGHIQLDVIVTDAAGKPATGLGPTAFRLLDNGQPRRILSFRSYDGAQVKPEPPVEAILLVDMANLPFDQVAFTRRELGRFLRENGGRLAQPTTLLVLTDTGIRVQPRPSVDGNALAAVVDKLSGNIRTINAAQGTGGDLERFQLSVRQLSTIADNEAHRPGRKLLIWVGPGWPMLDSAQFSFTEKDREHYFGGIVQLSTRLREARITLDSVAPLDSGVNAGTRTFLYQSFLKPVTSARQADSGNLALKVLATETGGLILGPDNDLTGQIDRCVADAGAFYRISFDPPHAEHADEYHDLKVELKDPELTARTFTGYYNQPEKP
jgi:VWFA-related protein